VEGLTEFLPVSSTAHLRILQAALGIDLGDPYWKTFSIVIQLGAILCLPVYFWQRLVGLLRGFPRGVRGDRTALDHPLTLTLIAFVVTAIPSFLLSKVIGKHLESLRVMALSLLVGGIVMWVVDARYERARRASRGGRLTATVDTMSLAQAVWIGACQILAAVFPGTSRSMATITAGELAGMTRPAALEFSFLLSIPTMAGRDARRRALVDGPGHRLRRVVRRRLRRRRLVHELGAPPRLRALRGLSHRAGHRRSLVVEPDALNHRAKGPEAACAGP